MSHTLMSLDAEWRRPARTSRARRGAEAEHVEDLGLHGDHLVGGAAAELEGPGVELEFGERVDHRPAVTPEERRPGSYPGSELGTPAVDRAPHARRIAGGNPATRDRWVRVSAGVSAGGRQEHLVDDVHDAVARLDVGLDDRHGVAGAVG